MVVCLGLLFSTVTLTGTTRMEVPFSTPGGQAGRVRLSFPTRVYAGEVAEINARISIKTGVDKSNPATLSGRLEAGYEEINPAGEVSINLSAGSPVEFSWLIRTARESTYPSYFWLWLETNHTRELILAKEFVLDSRFYMGRNVSSSRLLFASLLLLTSLVFLLSTRQHKPHLKKPGI